MATWFSGVDAKDVEHFLRAIFEASPPAAFVEVRFRHASGMGQSFHRVNAVGELAAEVALYARQRDVFVGVIPRRRHRGGRRDVVDQAAVAWADCDGDRAVAALQRFDPEPNMVVATGSGSNCHAYWFLAHPAPLDVLENTNRRIAAALEADVRSCDAARILRPAGTANWKAEPPRPVSLLALDVAARVDLHDLGQNLPAIALEHRRGPDRASSSRSAAADPLLEIAPPTYVEHLTGQTAGHDHKVHCPFHDDRSASLHVFNEPERGWFCFGCGRGGSIYDFAGLLWGRDLRGVGFVRLRRDLETTFATGRRHSKHAPVHARTPKADRSSRATPQRGLP